MSSPYMASLRRYVLRLTVRSCASQSASQSPLSESRSYQGPESRVRSVRRARRVPLCPSCMQCPCHCRPELQNGLIDGWWGGGAGVCVGGGGRYPCGGCSGTHLPLTRTWSSAHTGCGGGAPGRHRPPKTQKRLGARLPGAVGAATALLASMAARRVAKSMVLLLGEGPLRTIRDALICLPPGREGGRGRRASDGQQC